MIKAFLTAVLATIIATSYSQVNLKIGLFNSLSIDESLNKDHTVLGSTLAQIGYNQTGTVAFTLDAGWLRHGNWGEGFSQFPVMAGVKFRFDETFYTGIAGGISWYDSKVSGTNFTFSPYFGANIKRFSTDIRYLHAVKNQPIMLMAFILSYNF